MSEKFKWPTGMRTKMYSIWFQWRADGSNAQSLHYVGDFTMRRALSMFQPMVDALTPKVAVYAAEEIEGELLVTHELVPTLGWEPISFLIELSEPSGPGCTQNI